MQIHHRVANRICIKTPHFISDIGSKIRYSKVLQIILCILRKICICTYASKWKEMSVTYSPRVKWHLRQRNRNYRTFNFLIALGEPNLIEGTELVLEERLRE